jgi:hypothetical protein
MPINRLLRDDKIQPEEVERLNRAFMRTLKSLHLVDRDDPVCDIVARKVIEIGVSGAHNPEEISRIAINQLGFR